MESIWHATPAGTPADPADEGFVHASFTGQLAETLRLHYAAHDSLVLLRLDPARLGERLVIEPSRGGQQFPHIYGEVTADDVVERAAVRRGADGAFDLGGVIDRP